MEGKGLRWVVWVLFSAVFFACASVAKVSAQLRGREKELEVLLRRVADDLESRRFQLAINSARQLLVKYPNNPDVYLMLGLGYINLGNQVDSAVMMLEKGVGSLEEKDLGSETGLDLQLSIGKAYQLASKPQSAIDTYGKLMFLVPAENDSLIREINDEVQICENAILLMSNPIDLKISNLGEKVNSPFDEHTPLPDLKGNELLFTSRRKHQGLTLLDDGQYAEKICVAGKKDGGWDQSRLLNVFYRKMEHESAVSISVDGKSLFLFKNDADGKNLYISRKTVAGWSTPRRLSEPINSYDDETHCSLSADGSTLVFTSDRPGGIGGMDIYMSKKLVDGTWGDARNLGPNINTPLNEDTPMLYLDGRTMYFASEGHNSMGMFDVFYAQMNADSTWSEPINLGYPINSPGDDMFFVPTIERNRAYYATSHFADNKGGMDIYLVEFDPHFSGRLAVIEGKVEQGEQSKVVRLLVSRTSDKELVGDYRPDPLTGEYTLLVETGQRYSITRVMQTLTEEPVGEITVGEELAFENKPNGVPMHDLDIEPPLSPSLAKLPLEMVVSVDSSQSINRVAEELVAQAVQPVVSQKEEQVKEDATKASVASREANLVPQETPVGNNAHVVDEEGNITKPSDAMEGRGHNEKATKEKVHVKVMAETSGYTIQLLALREGRIRDYSYFKGFEADMISELICRDGFTRYTYRVYADLPSAMRTRASIMKAGVFKDAFVRPIAPLLKMKK